MQNVYEQFVDVSIDDKSDNLFEFINYLSKNLLDNSLVTMPAPTTEKKVEVLILTKITQIMMMIIGCVTQ